MKKFMKVCAITALILVIVGVALTIVGGSIEGVSRIHEVVESVTDGKVNVNLGNGDGWGISINGDDWKGEEVHYEIDDEMMFDTGYEILKGDIEKFAVGSGVAKLDIRAGGCKFQVEESGDDSFYVEARSVGKLQCFIEDETLYVKVNNTLTEIWDYDDCEVLLYVPANYGYEQVDIEIGAGLLEVGELLAPQIDLKVGAGQLIADYIQAEKCYIEVGMGEMVVKDIQVTKVNAEVGMGNLELDGTILGDVVAECAMGSIEMKLGGREEDFNYTIECAMGNVSVDGKDYGGLEQDKTVRNSAGKNMAIECAMGDVIVDFEE